MVGVDIGHDSVVVVDDLDIVFEDEFPPCVVPSGWGHAVPTFVFGDCFGEGFGLAGEEIVEFEAGFVDEVVWVWGVLVSSLDRRGRW